jgi:hypothetical protein
MTVKVASSLFNSDADVKYYFQTTIAMAFAQFRVQSTRRLGFLSQSVLAKNSSSVLCRSWLQRAGYASVAGLNRSDIQARVLDVMKTFEKVDPAKVCFFFDLKQHLKIW